MDVSEREVLRLLGSGEIAGGRLSGLIRALIEELSERARPKSAYGLWEVHTEQPIISIGSMRIKSDSLSKHLEGAVYAVLLAATLGAEADALVRRYSAADMERAVAANAICAAMIEAYCDELGREIIKSEKVAGLCASTRFSPGYGDFDMGYQADILLMLNAGKRIGLTLTNGMMLTPTKSVVAVIGFGRGMKNGGDKCAGCDNVDCIYRLPNIS